MKCQFRAPVILKGASSGQSHQNICSNPAGREGKPLHGQMRIGYGRKWMRARFPWNGEVGNRAVRR